MRIIFVLIACLSVPAQGSLPDRTQQVTIGTPRFDNSGFKSTNVELSPESETPLVFDIPISYNKKVQKWVHYFQTRGRKWFHLWIERSHKVLPTIQSILEREGLPRDLAYMAMIESGFSNHARSHKDAVGPWQFIAPTATRYGLNVNWWLDERKDLDKSTKAAARYMKDLFTMFGSWYLVAAAYNTGENRVKNLIKKHQTKNFWELVRKGAFVEETENYIPKFLAAALISKAPNLYGFRDIKIEPPMKYEFFNAPGGVHLSSLAKELGVSVSYLRKINPDLAQDHIPGTVSHHQLRLPKGSLVKVSEFLRKNPF